MLYFAKFYDYSDLKSKVVSDYLDFLKMQLKREFMKLKNIDPEELKRLFLEDGFTLRKIGKIFGVHHTVIMNHLKKCGIYKRQKGFPLPKEQAEKAKELYEQGDDAMIIAKKFNRNKSTIFYWLRKLGCKMRTREERIFRQHRVNGKLTKKLKFENVEEEMDFNKKMGLDYKNYLLKERIKKENDIKKNCPHKTIIGNKCFRCKEILSITPPTRGGA